MIMLQNLFQNHHKILKQKREKFQLWKNQMITLTNSKLLVQKGCKKINSKATD